MFHTRAAIIGCGMIGRRYRDSFRKLGVQLVAAADPDLSRAAALCSESEARPYADYRQMLAATDADLVCICSPTPHHYEQALAVLEQGRRLFCEKPLSETLAQGRAMVRAATARGVTIGFGFKFRFEAPCVRAHELIAEGAIGMPRFAIFSYFQEVPPAERAWYCSFGALRDMIPHAIDLAGWFLGRQPHTVTAQLNRTLGLPSEDAAFLHLDYGEGVRAAIQGGWVDRSYTPVGGNRDLLFQVVGDRGYLAASRWGALIRTTHDGIIEEKVPPADAFTSELEAFLNALEGGYPPPVTAEAGLVAQAVIEAAYASGASGSPETIGVWA